MFELVEDFRDAVAPGGAGPDHALLADLARAWNDVLRDLLLGMVMEVTKEELHAGRKAASHLGRLARLLPDAEANALRASAHLMIGEAAAEAELWVKAAGRLLRARRGMGGGPFAALVPGCELQLGNAVDHLDRRADAVAHWTAARAGFLDVDEWGGAAAATAMLAWAAGGVRPRPHHCRPVERGRRPRGPRRGARRGPRLRDPLLRAGRHPRRRPRGARPDRRPAARRRAARGRRPPRCSGRGARPDPAPDDVRGGRRVGVEPGPPVGRHRAAGVGGPAGRRRCRGARPGHGRSRRGGRCGGPRARRGGRGPAARRAGGRPQAGHAVGRTVLRPSTRWGARRHRGGGRGPARRPDARSDVGRPGKSRRRAARARVADPAVRHGGCGHAAGRGTDGADRSRAGGGVQARSSRPNGRRAGQPGRRDDPAGAGAGGGLPERPAQCALRRGRARRPYDGRARPRRPGRPHRRPRRGRRRAGRCGDAARGPGGAGGAEPRRAPARRWTDPGSP